MQRIIVTALIALAGLALAHAGGSQFPAQRFGKVTADSLALTSGTQVTTVAAPDVARWNSLQSGIREELDPVFSTSAAGAITGTDVAAWNSFVVNNAWLTNVLYPAEALTLRSLNLSRNFGTPHRLLVQGYHDAAWSGNLTLNLGSGSSAEIRAAHLFSNLPIYQTPYYMMLDHDTGNVWWVFTEPAGSYFLAYKFDVPTQVNRVRHYKYGGWGNPWPSFTVWGSDDSTGGDDGHWTQISGSFTLSSNMEAVNTCDFAQNTRSFLWVKLVGAPQTVVENAGVSEIEFESYQPAPDKRFWVDARGNPGTDGTMTAAALTLTTNSQTVTVGIADIQACKNDPWSWTDDNQNITAKYKNVILGAATAGSERLKVIGFQGSGYTANLARLAGTTYYAISNFSNQSWYGPAASFDGVIAAASGGSGNGWAPGAGSPVWLVFKFQSGVTKVVNKLTLWREGSGSIPWESYSVYGSNNTTNGADGTWELLAGPFLPRIGGGQYYQTLSEDVVFNDNQKSFGAYKIMGPSRSGRVLEVEAYTYAPTPDKTFSVDAQGNPGTDGRMTAGTIKFTPLFAAPDSPTTGTAYFDSPLRKLRVWDGSAWQNAW